MSKTVGVVGLGAMGSAMAIMLVKAGFEVVGFDLREAALDELEDNGGKRANSPRDVAALADVVLLANVLHDWTQDRGRQLLTRVLGSMATGGAVLVKEYFLEDDWHGATESLVQSLWVIGPNGKSGWQPTYGEMESLLAEVGFCDVQRDDYLVQGRKP